MLVSTLRLLLILATCAVAHLTDRTTRAALNPSCPNATIKEETTRSGVVVTQFLCHEAAEPRGNSELVKHSDEGSLFASEIPCNRACYRKFPPASPTQAAEADCYYIAKYLAHNGRDIEVNAQSIWQYVWETCAFRLTNNHPTEPMTFDVGLITGYIKYFDDACGYIGGGCNLPSVQGSIPTYSIQVLPVGWVIAGVDPTP